MGARIAILTSGSSRGSNFEAIYQYFQKQRLPVEIAFVTVNRKDAPIRERCKRLGVSCHHIPTQDYCQFEHKLGVYVEAQEIDLIVLAGFMRKLSPDFIRNAGCPIVNIHPALLPKYGGKGMFGMKVHEAVFQSGDTMSGASVHYVNEQYDAGKIIAQKSVSVRTCKSPQEIAKKVLRIEHALYPKVIWQVLRAHKRMRRQAKRSLTTTIA